MLRGFTRLCLLVFAAAALIVTGVWAQAIFATLTGVISDPSGAVVTNAKVTLRNAQSGDVRQTVTDSQGYYTFASVPVGTYNISVEAPGFQTFKEDGIALGGGEKRNVNASLQVGSTNQTVVVTGSADIVAPVDSGEKVERAHVATTRKLCSGGQQRGRIHQNHARFRQLQWDTE